MTKSEIISIIQRYQIDETSSTGTTGEKIISWEDFEDIANDILKLCSSTAQQPVRKTLDEATMYSLLDKDIPSAMSRYGNKDGTWETSTDYNAGHRDSWIKGFKAAELYAQAKAVEPQEGWVSKEVFTQLLAGSYTSRANFSYEEYRDHWYELAGLDLPPKPTTNN